MNHEKKGIGTNTEEAWNLALEKATKAISNREADPFHVERAMERALALKTAEFTFDPVCPDRDIGRSDLRRSIQVTRFRLQLVSGVSIAAIAIWILFGIAFPDRMAFAQVQQRLAKTRTLQFSYSTTQADGMGKGRVYAIEPYFLREELPDGRVIIVDTNAMKEMFINVQEKKAEIYPIYNVDRQRQCLEWIVRLREAAADGTEYIGKRLLDGLPVLDYRISISDGQEYWRVSVDESSRLPVSIERVQSRSGEVLAFAKDFVFDREIEQQLVSLDAPAGFEVTTFTRNPDFDSTQLVVGEDGLGPIVWGMNKEQVIGHLGKPEATVKYQATDKTPDGLRYGRSAEELAFDSEGVRIIVSVRDGVEMIRCYGGTGDRFLPFKGISDRGVRMGDTREAVLAVYGTPTTSSRSNLVYRALGLTFSFIGDRLQGIEAVSPILRPNEDGTMSIRLGDQ